MTRHLLCDSSRLFIHDPNKHWKHSLFLGSSSAENNSNLNLELIYLVIERFEMIKAIYHQKDPLLQLFDRNLPAGKYNI